MQMPLPEFFPLTVDEKEQLADLYKKQARKALAVFISFTFVLSIISFTGFGFLVYAMANDVFLGGGDTWMVDQHFLSGWYLKIGIAALISVILCAFSFLNITLPHKLDAASGLKCRMPFRIIRKEYFPVTGQYFFTLSGANDRHCEVAQEIYEKCVEGDTVFIDMGFKSKYIFTDSDRFMPIIVKSADISNANA